jgi:hypothetical protein
MTETPKLIQPSIVEDYRVLTQATGERWWYSHADILTTQFRSMRVSRGTNCYYLSMKNDLNIYRFKNISELADHIQKIKVQGQLVLDL